MEGAIRVSRQKCFNLIGEPDDLFTCEVEKCEAKAVDEKEDCTEVCGTEIIAWFNLNLR